MIIRKSNPNGFSMVEMLMALMIMGMLLAAVAVAVHASSVNYRQNEEMYRAMTTARAALLRITNDIRTAQGVEVTEPAGQCSMVTAAGSDITYLYNSGDSTLYLVTNDDPDDADYVLCSGVTAITFDRATVPDDAGKVRNVQISMTVTVGSNSQTIATAAVLRKNLQ
jgi:prepilin-type N-terminal cleavage/methylation domain-containing protein